MGPINNIQAAAYELFSSSKALRAIRVQDSAEALSVASVALYFDYEPFILPDIRAQSEDLASYFKDELAELNSVLRASLKSPKALLIIPNATAALALWPLDEGKIIEFASKQDIQALQNWLLDNGYKPTSTVLDVAEFAINAGKVDVFSPNAPNPYRIVFFDDEIESIKEFDISTQLSISDEIYSIEIVPLITQLFNKSSLLSVFSPEALKEPKRFKDEKIFITQSMFDANKSRAITLLASNESKFASFNLGANVRRVISSAHFNISSQSELILSLNQPIKKSKVRRIKLDINSLRKGDYVVHERYGIGQFMGLELISNLGTLTECVRINYAGNDALLLPSTALNLLEPYSASSTPVLDHLGKSSFLKLKDKIRPKLMQIAAQIANLAAQRVLVKAPKFSKSLDYEIFKAAAGFELSSDQIKVCDEIFADFAKGYPMDRLLCADVGFGKTEVAMHAAFACAKAGYRALFLVPTTLLCAQHYATLKARFAPFNIRILRFDSTIKKANLLKQLEQDEKPTEATGEIIVGTHSLLGLDLDKVGLIIVDEEHKFGVKQKEKLKQLSTSAHYLSMSATPIPRTLSQALSSLKGYSLINTPPNERIGTISFLRQIDDALIKEALLREKSRGGQSFYIHNRLISLEQKAQYLSKLLPDFTIAILSSATKPADKESILKDFLDDKFDILLSTSIVESGLDMPRANTIIIERADLFGVADLHQLRGRVGRSNRQGFCYFLIEDECPQNALIRLESLASNSYLGAGAALAQMDLELRGGGNLLGAEQSGHIEALGYGLYIKMLEDEINKLSANYHSGQMCELKLQVSAYLDSAIINDDGVRLEFYRRLANAKTATELSQIEDEIKDRFAEPSQPCVLYFMLMRLRLKASNANIVQISSFESNIKLSYQDGSSKVIKAKDASSYEILSAALNAIG